MLAGKKETSEESSLRSVGGKRVEEIKGVGCLNNKGDSSLSVVPLGTSLSRETCAPRRTCSQLEGREAEEKGGKKKRPLLRFPFFFLLIFLRICGPLSLGTPPNVREIKGSPVFVSLESLFLFEVHRFGTMRAALLRFHFSNVDCKRR